MILVTTVDIKEAESELDTQTVQPTIVRIARDGYPTPTVTPTATPTATTPSWPSDRQLTDTEMVELAEYVGFVNVEDAVSVAWCESRFKPYAIGSHAGELGLWQIHPGNRSRVEDLGYTLEDMLLPVPNAVVAATWSEGGANWGEWTCQP
jgi:hypothetical protein